MSGVSCVAQLDFQSKLRCEIFHDTIMDEEASGPCGFMYATHYSFEASIVVV